MAEQLGEEIGGGAERLAALGAHPGQDSDRTGAAVSENEGWMLGWTA